jgi:hypothetical protein
MGSMNRIFHPDGTAPEQAEGWIWVFGSNFAGSHGGGAARVASHRFGAVHGVAVGRTGSAYALPTINKYGDRLSVKEIATHISAFLDYARTHPDEMFWVTGVGCGIAGNKDKDIASLFADAPSNCSLPDAWRQLLN